MCAFVRMDMSTVAFSVIFIPVSVFVSYTNFYGCVRVCFDVCVCVCYLGPFAHVCVCVSVFVSVNEFFYLMCV